MNKAGFAHKMNEIRDSLIRIRDKEGGDEKEKEGIRKLFATMVEETNQLKERGTSGTTEIPESFRGLTNFLVGDRWYWSFLDDVRNAFIDYLELALEKK